MIDGVGTDLIRISRIRKLAKRFPDRIGQKVFTAGELEYCRAKKDPAPSLAGRFAAKEAVMKALGTGWRGGVRFIDIEYLGILGGNKEVKLTWEHSSYVESSGQRQIDERVPRTAKPSGPGFGRSSSTG